MPDAQRTSGIKMATVVSCGLWQPPPGPGGKPKPYNGATQACTGYFAGTELRGSVSVQEEG